MVSMRSRTGPNPVSPAFMPPPRRAGLVAIKAGGAMLATGLLPKNHHKEVHT